MGEGVLRVVVPWQNELADLAHHAQQLAGEVGLQVLLQPGLLLLLGCGRIHDCLQQMQGHTLVGRKDKAAMHEVPPG